jgi:hypothetical protein
MSDRDAADAPPPDAELAIDRISRFIKAVRYIRDEFEPLGVPARRIAQLDIVIMESEAELRRLLAARDA